MATGAWRIQAPWIERLGFDFRMPWKKCVMTVAQEAVSLVLAPPSELMHSDATSRQTKGVSASMQFTGH